MYINRGALLWGRCSWNESWGRPAKKQRRDPCRRFSFLQQFAHTASAPLRNGKSQQTFCSANLHRWFFQQFAPRLFHSADVNCLKKKDETIKLSQSIFQVLTQKPLISDEQQGNCLLNIAWFCVGMWCQDKVNNVSHQQANFFALECWLSANKFNNLCT